MSTEKPQADSLLSEVQPKIDDGEFEFMRKYAREDTVCDSYDSFMAGMQDYLADIPLEYAPIEKYGTIDQSEYFVPQDAPRLSKDDRDALQNLSDAIQTVLENGGQSLARLNLRFFRPEYDEANQALWDNDGDDTEAKQRFSEALKKMQTKETILSILEKLQAASDMTGVKLHTRPPKAANQWYLNLMLMYFHHTLEWPTGKVSKNDPFSRLCRLIFPKFTEDQHKRYIKNAKRMFPQVIGLMLPKTM